MTNPATVDWPTRLRQLAAGWRTVALTALVAVLVALLPALVERYRYRAEAVLALARPEVRLEFDERFPAAELNPAFPYRAGSVRTYPELAASDAVADAVVTRLDGAVPEASTVTALRRRVRVRARADGTLLAVEARASTPDRAAQLANTFAAVLTERVADVFGGLGSSKALATEQAGAAAALATAEANLVAFHATSALPAAEVELDALADRYRSLLAAETRLAAVARDADALRRGLEAGQADDRIAARYALLVLRLNALTSSLPPVEEMAVPELALPPLGAADAVTTTEIETLLAAVDAARGAVSDALQPLPAALRTPRAAQGAAEVELDTLEREVALAEERYRSLARMVDAEVVARTAVRPELRLASPAVPPERPAPRGLVRRGAAGLLLGLLAGGLLVLLWPSRRPPA